MKFLRIADDTYINSERVDIIISFHGFLKVFVGGCSEAWTVEEKYAKDVLACVQGDGNREEQRKGEE